MADLFTFLLITHILLNKQNIIIKLLSCEFGAEGRISRHLSEVYVGRGEGQYEVSLSTLLIDIYLEHLI